MGANHCYLARERETRNCHDRFVVAIKKSCEVVSHVLNFLLYNETACRPWKILEIVLRIFLRWCRAWHRIPGAKIIYYNQAMQCKKFQILIRKTLTNSSNLSPSNFCITQYTH